VHKAQGQEMTRVLMDVTTPTFAHGQLYVALSRIRHRDTIAAYVTAEAVSSPELTVQNVVFPDLVQNL